MTKNDEQKWRRCPHCDLKGISQICGGCGQSLTDTSGKIRPTKELREMIRRDIEQLLPHHMKGEAVALFDFHTDSFGYDNLGYCLAVQDANVPDLIYLYWEVGARTFTKQSFDDLAREVLEKARTNRRRDFPGEGT